MNWLSDIHPDRRPPICMFPKHREKPWPEVVREDRPYVEWLVSGKGPEIDGELYDYLIDLLEES